MSNAQHDGLNRILIFGIGNPGRKDDGLGIAFAEKMEKWMRKKGINHIEVDRNYQLNIEDAYNLSNYDLVLLADASMENIGQYKFTFVEPSEKVNFSMHAISPSYIAYLCRVLYDCHPLIFLLHIKGYEWQLEEGLTVKAAFNLKKAIKFTCKLFKKLNISIARSKEQNNKKPEKI